jgi:hypothetical protein
MPRPADCLVRAAATHAGVRVNGDIELEIGAGSGVGNYAVRVIHAAAGGEPVGALELDVDELLSRRDVLEATVLASAVRRRSVPINERPVREVGRQLFQALFTGPVYGTYRASLGAAQQQGKRLRLVLRLTAPELAALPWEMLFDPETETYLCRQEPLVRHVPAPYTAEPLEVRSPLRILGLVASPRGLQALDVEAEKAHLAGALAGPAADGLVELVWVSQATWDGVHAQLLAGQWHVLHFVGHGDYDTTTDEGVLALVGRDGRADMVGAGRLADLLGEAQPAPRLVVLNSCSSGQAGANDLFSGTAAALVRSGISAVAAMQFTVSDNAAVAFARGFYTAVARGRSVDEAARSGRISILGTPGSLEWVTPVLYVRGQATQLFTLASSRVGSRERPPRHQAAEPIRRGRAQLSALYVEARAELRLGHFDTAIGLFDDLLILDPGYPGAAGLRDTAQSSQHLANTFALAVKAEDGGDWIAAGRGYEEVLGIDPGYRDASARKEVCQARQRVADLQAELGQHARAGQWQAVLDVDAELVGLDPSAADPDGLATRARNAVAAEQRSTELERRYTEARAAEDSGDWIAAGRGYEEVLGIEPDYQDAAARRDLFRQVVSLRAELEGQAAAEDWPRVLVTIKELTKLDPAAIANPLYDNLAARARREVARLTAEPLWRIDIGDRVRALSWHPGGRLIAVGTEVSTANKEQVGVRVYDISGQEPGVRLSIKKSYGVTGATFSPDGTRLAAGSYGSLARVWDAASGKDLLELPHPDAVTTIAFSPDGTRLATGGWYQSAWIWDATSGIKLLDIRHELSAVRRSIGRVYSASVNLPIPKRAVNAVAFSPDGTRLATGSHDRYARIWDAASGKQLLQVLHDNEVNTVAFSPDGTRLATGGWDGGRIWDAASGEKLLEVAHAGQVRTVAFSPDGTWLATGGGDKCARIWDAASGEKLLEVHHAARVTTVAFSPDGSWLATGSDDKSVRIWPAAEQ